MVAVLESIARPGGPEIALQVLTRRYERFGDETPAERAEATIRAGLSHKGSGAQECSSSAQS